MTEPARGTTGVGMFFLGLIMAAAGLYLISRNVILHSGFGSYFWGIPFGLTLVPLLVGVGWLFYDDRSVAAWVVSAVGLTIVIAEILISINMALKPITLYEGFIMFGLFAGGIGLVARSVRRTRETGGQAGTPG